MLELLAPAGSMEALRAAVQNGADAVYLGAGAFHARQGARNFTVETLREAVQYAHVRGVAVHLTLNTLVLDRECQQAAELIRAAARAGVDALIVQDLGILALCRQIAPHIPIHASTQMSIHSLDGVYQAAALGVSRVILAGSCLGKKLPYAGTVRWRLKCLSTVRFACVTRDSAICPASSAAGPGTGGSAPSPAACPMATDVLRTGIP